MLKSIIVDDELKSRESLKKMVATFCQDVEVMATCQNVAEAIKAVEEFKHDLLVGPKHSKVDHLEEIVVDPSGRYPTFRIERP